MANQTALERQDVQDNAAYLPYLPEHLRQRYLDGLEDAQLTHLRRQIALLDVRIKMLLETLDRQVLTPEKLSLSVQEEFEELSPQLADEVADFLSTYLPDGFLDTRTFRSLERLVTKYEKAMADKRLIQAHEALDQLFSAIRQGRRDGEIWKEIDAVMDSRRKLVEAEERRLAQTQRMMTEKQAVDILLAAIQSMQEAVMLYEPDRGVQELILSAARRAYESRLIGAIDLSADAKRVDESY